MRKIFVQLCIAGLLTFGGGAQAWGFACTCVATAQEGTQLANKLQLIKQLAEQIQMVKNQYQMLEGLTGGMIGSLNSANNQIMAQFQKVQDVWKKATSLTHAMDNFDDLHQKRHPEHKEGTQVNAEEERRRRDKEYKGMLDAYLKGINMNALDLENTARARQKLFDALQSTEGQVQAIQALGALINHSSMITEKNGEITSAYVTMFAENEQDKRDAVDNENKNFQKAIEHTKNLKPSGKGFLPTVPK